MFCKRFDLFTITKILVGLSSFFILGIVGISHFLTAMGITENINVILNRNVLWWFEIVILSIILLGLCFLCGVRGGPDGYYKTGKALSWKIADSVKNLYDMAWLTVVMIITVKATGYLASGLKELIMPIPWINSVNLVKSLAIALGIGAGASSAFYFRAMTNKRNAFVAMKVAVSEEFKKKSCSNKAQDLLNNLEQHLSAQTTNRDLKEEWEILEQLEKYINNKRILELIKYFRNVYQEGIKEKNIETLNDALALAISLIIALYAANFIDGLYIIGSFFVLKLIWKSIFLYRSQLYYRLVQSLPVKHINIKKIIQQLKPAALSSSLKAKTANVFCQRVKYLKYCKLTDVLKRIMPYNGVTLIASYLTGVIAPFIQRTPLIVAVSSGIKHGSGILEENENSIYNGFMYYVWILLFVRTQSHSIDWNTIGLIMIIHFLWTYALPIRKFLVERINNPAILLKEWQIQSRYQRICLLSIEEVLKYKKENNADQFIEIIGCQHANPFIKNLAYIYECLPIVKFDINNRKNTKEIVANFVHYFFQNSHQYDGGNFAVKMPEQYTDGVKILKEYGIKTFSNWTDAQKIIEL